MARHKPKAATTLDETQVAVAFERLAKARALQTLVRGALPPELLRRLLKDALPVRSAREMPPEVFAGLAGGIALSSPAFGVPLAQALHDRLAWDQEPADEDEWWRLVRERPLEALWMASLSASREVRKEFTHIASHCLENYRASPDCLPPTWDFVDGLLELQSNTVAELEQLEHTAEETRRKQEADRERLEDLREELRKLRRENGELRAGKAQAERQVQALSERSVPPPVIEDPKRAEEIERRLRKTEKEREHLTREVERLRVLARYAPAEEALPPPASEAEGPDAAGALASEEAALADDPNPRRRVVRQMLRKLIAKGKIGASHTHEDNFYRGVADHEKGIAKLAMDLLYLEGFLVPKTTVSDPHVSLSPARLAEVRAIIAGDVVNPRLARFIEG